MYGRFYLTTILIAVFINNSCYCMYCKHYQTIIHPIHVTAMMNKKRGLEGKFARQYVNRDVRSLLLHVPVA